MAKEPIEPGREPIFELPAHQWPSSPVRETMQPGATGVGVCLEVETIQPKQIGREYVYSAKFLCGKIPHSLLDPQDPPVGFPLVPGTYRTAINIHNPNLTEVRFLKLALTTNPQGQPRGKAGLPVGEMLGPNEGLEVDCDNIEALLATGSGIDLGHNTNPDTVFDNPGGPPSQTTFQLNDPAVIRQLVTYHWHNGSGDPPTVGVPVGAIGLNDATTGAVIIPLTPAQGFPGQNNAPNVNWVANVNQLVQPGTYRVIDTRPQTWSYNQASGNASGAGNAGFATVRGSPFFPGRAPVFFKGFVVIRCPEQLDVVGVYTLKNVIAAVPNPPTGRSLPIHVEVALSPDRDTYHLHDTIRITATIVGGHPPYNPVTVTLNSPDLLGIGPYPIASSSTATNQFSLSWEVYLKGPHSPGTWNDLDKCTISVDVTDVTGSMGSGASRMFHLTNP